jgi:hypothetical protein
MFIYVRTRAHGICPGYDTVVHFVLSDARNICHSRKYTKMANVAIYIEQREYPVVYGRLPSMDEGVPTSVQRMIVMS